MSLYITPSTKGTVAIAVCDRCKRKVPYDELRPDGNSPGLRVCGDPGCWDHKDPYRLPVRKSEIISLRHPRPDDGLELDTDTMICTEFGVNINFPPEISV